MDKDNVIQLFISCRSKRQVIGVLATWYKDSRLPFAVNVILMHVK